MAFSYSEGKGNGRNTVFPFAFSGRGTGYIRPEDIHVLVEGVEVYGFVLSGTNQVQLAVVASCLLRIRQSLMELLLEP
jgi:hypothetical protein